MAKLIDQDERQYIPLNDSSRFILGRPHRATVWRWALRGIKRGGKTVKLNTTAVGARRYTTLADIDRFLLACNGSPELPQQAERVLSSPAAAAGEMVTANLNALAKCPQATGRPAHESESVKCK